MPNYLGIALSTVKGQRLFTALCNDHKEDTAVYSIVSDDILVKSLYSRK
jgi:hypothetical protein